MVVPVNGKDPLKMNSYQGITRTEIAGGKVLKLHLLETLEMVFLLAGLPHVNQTAYCKSLSCADAIFTTQEVTAK